MSILVNRCVRRAHLAEELVESWEVEHPAVIVALDLEEIVSECLDLSELLKHSWKQLLGRLYDEELCDIDRQGKFFEACVTRTISLLERVSGFIPVMKNKGHEIARADELDGASSDMKQLKEAIKKEWPRIDPAMTEEALADYRDGKYTDAETLLNEC